MWSQILILILSVFSAVILSAKMSASANDVKYTGVILFVLVFFAGFLPLIEIHYGSLITEYINISIFSVALVILLMTIRRLRPDIARYPYGFVFIPILIALFYPFIQGTESITNIIFMMIQAGPILVLILLAAGHHDHFKRGWLMAAGITCLLAAFTIYWVISEFYDTQIWMWQALIAFGMVSLANTFPNLFTDEFK